VIHKLRGIKEEEMMDTAHQLEELVHEVGEAHPQAYIETDGADPEWPLW
jgi:hypothetical protein